MGLSLSGSNGRSNREGVILDFTEELDGIGNSTAVQTLATINRGNGHQVTPTPTAILSVVSGGPTAGFDAALGRTVRNIASAAGAVGFLSSSYRPRVSPRGSVAGAPPAAILPPELMQTYAIPCRNTVAGTAQMQIGFMVSAGGLDIVGTSAGAIWASDAGTFGGNWYPRYRLTNGGAVVAGPNSGIVATAWHTPGLRIVPGAVPRLEWLMDGVPKFSLSGDANMLALQTALPGGYVLGALCGTPAGSTFQLLGARWRVEEVS
jgi:hypothetical protein